MPSAITRLRNRCLSVNRSVKIAVFLIASVVIFFYVIPHVAEFVRIRNLHFYRTKNLDVCISQKLEKHGDAIAHFDAVAVHDALPSQYNARGPLLYGVDQSNVQLNLIDNTEVASHYLAFVGNGYIGIDLRFPGGESTGNLLVRCDRTITLSSTVNPLLRIGITEYSRESSLLISFRDGLLRELSCFRKSDFCVSVERVAYVHRVYPAVLIQEVHVSNPVKRAVTVHLDSSPQLLTSASSSIGGLQFEPLTSSTLAKLATSGLAMVKGEKKLVEARTVLVRDKDLPIGSDGSVLPVRLFVEAVFLTSNNIGVLTGAGDKLQLIAIAVINYGTSRDWAAERAAATDADWHAATDRLFAEASVRKLELPVDAQSTRSHVECTFVRSRTVALKDISAEKIDAEVALLEADLNEDLLSLATRFCRFQLAIASRGNTKTAPRADSDKRRKSRPTAKNPRRKANPIADIALTRRRRDADSVVVRLNSQVDADAAIEYGLEYDRLRALHVLGWNALYSNGSSFEISYSKAPRVLNPVRINATVFYLLCQVPLFAPADVPTSSTVSMRNATGLDELLVADRLETPETIQWDDGETSDVLGRVAQLTRPRKIGEPRTLDACFESRVSTFAAGASGVLWQPVFDVRSLAAASDAWLVTLTKKRCALLLRAGAFGLLEAAILSFGPFRFVHSHSDRPHAELQGTGAGADWNWDDAVHRHLELVADPNDLHRDRMRFGRLFFNRDAAINVRIELESGSDKPFLYIDAERTTQRIEDADLPALTLYATDAELKTIVELQIAAGQRRTSQSTRFALKYTDPATALLYVAESRQHLEELRVATLVRNVHEFEAHPPDVISMHREGHSFGGLPTAFWVLIGALIVVFHLFLIKLIYEEFCTRKQRVESTSEMTATHGQVWRFGSSFRRQRNTSSNSSDVFADDYNSAAANAIALKRLLIENVSRSRRDSSN